MSLILANIIIFLLWLWIIATILPIFRWEKFIITTSVISAAIGASLLWISPQFIEGAFLMGGRQAQGVARSIIFVLAIISLIAQPSQRKKLLQTTLMIAGIALIGQLIITQLPNPTQGLVQFFFCIAMIEEWIKYSIAQYTTAKRSIHSTDILLFGLIAALSYAWRENTLITTQISDIIGRTPTYLMHSIFTTVFLVGVYLTHQGKSRRYMIVAIIIALTLHVGHNITGGDLHRTIRVITIIIRYSILTYILSHTDSIYLTHRDTLANS